MCNPDANTILTGVFFVAGALALGAYATYFARHHGNPLWWIVSGGSLVFVIGVVGQRAYALPSGCTKTLDAHPGMWDASWPIYFTPWHADPVAVAGAFLTLVGVGLLFAFEHVNGAPPAVAVPEPDFEELDAV